MNQFKNGFKLTTKTIGFYCTNGFYTFLAFQRHKVCNFCIYGLKDMIFASLQEFKQFKYNLNSGLARSLTRGCFLLGSTDSGGLGFVAIGFYADLTHQLILTPSLSDLFRSFRSGSYGADAKGRGAHRGARVSVAGSEVAIQR
jgi:hypothetical protein